LREMTLAIGLLQEMLGEHRESIEKSFGRCV